MDQRCPPGAMWKHFSAAASWPGMCNCQWSRVSPSSNSSVSTSTPTLLWTQRVNMVSNLYHCVICQHIYAPFVPVKNLLQTYYNLGWLIVFPIPSIWGLIRGGGGISEGFCQGLWTHMSPTHCLRPAGMWTFKCRDKTVNCWGIVRWPFNLCSISFMLHAR